MCKPSPRDGVVPSSGGAARRHYSRSAGLRAADPVLYGHATCNALVGYRGRIYSQDNELRMEVQQFLLNPLAPPTLWRWGDYEDGA